MSQPLAGMSLDQQIGQVFMVGFPGATPSPAVLELIQQQFVGGIILFSRNVRGPAHLLELTSALRQAARAAGQHHPLLIAIDQENGIVRRLGPGATVLPGSMALGATGSHELAYQVAYATGQELRALGINLNLAPVVDINNNPANPVIGVRSFGADPQLVARLGVAMVRGMRAAGVLATLKHFPGHGDTAVDSHRDVPVLDVDLERLEAVELVPFRAGIAADAPCVMTAHVAVPRLTGGERVPATLAPEIVRGLLRERLGYQGVIISDCLEMKAISATVGTAQGAVRALRAGADLLLVSHRADRQRASLAAVRAALASGTLDTATIAQAAERIVRLKARMLSWDALPHASALADAVGTPDHQRIAEQAYARSTTLVRDAGGLLPLRLAADAELVVLAPRRTHRTQAEDRDFAAGSLLAALQRRHANARVIALAPDAPAGERAAALAAVRHAGMTLLVTFNAHLDPDQLALARAVAAASPRVAGLVVGNPYDALALPELGTLVLTYEYTEPALESAVRVLFGEAPALGRAPVAL